jgi:uncharacterized alkaline shock family protein YloU
VLLLYLFDRIVLTIYTFSLAFLSLAFLSLSFGLNSPLFYLENALGTSGGAWGIGIIAFIFFIASIRLLYYAFGPRRKGGTVIRENEMGEVRISLSAIENLVRKVVRQVEGVRDVRAAVAVPPTGLVVHARVSVSPDVAIPEVSDDIQTSVKNYVNNIVGINVIEVRVLVDNITNETRRTRVD